MKKNISKTFILALALRFLYGAFPGAILGFFIGRQAYESSKKAVALGKQYTWAAFTMGDFIGTIVECSLFFGALVLAIYVVRTIGIKVITSQENEEEKSSDSSEE